MAEFPDLGRHCSYSECHLLDFLPVRCDACGKDFCASHFSYDSHNCESSYRKDIQVPVCPLCGKPVPVNRGELPDRLVGLHIDTDCKSDPAKAKRGKIYTNRCSHSGCKNRELVSIRCIDCGRNFCLKHRFASDHNCDGKATTIDGRRISPAAAAALARQKQQSVSSSNCKAKPASASVSSATFSGMSEDEALARALQASLNSNESPQLTQEEIDRAIAEQLQRDEYQRQPQTQRASTASSSNDKCAIS